MSPQNNFWALIIWRPFGFVIKAWSHCRDPAGREGAFLNSDDTGLTTNVFLTDPKLIGIRVTKNW